VLILCSIYVTAFLDADGLNDAVMSINHQGLEPCRPYALRGRVDVFEARYRDLFESWFKRNNEFKAAA